MTSRLTILIGTLVVLFILAQLLAYRKLNVIKRFKIVNTIELSDEEALLELSLLCSQLEINVYLMDKTSLQYLDKYGPEKLKILLQDKLNKFYSFGIDGKDMHLFQAQIDPILQIKGFDILYIKNIQPRQLPKPQLKNKVVAIILRKQDLVFHIFVLHSRESFWWIGSILSDPYLSDHLKSFAISIQSHMDVLSQERALEKLPTIPFLPVPGLYVPQNISHFLHDFGTSHFVECPISKAKTFSKQHRFITPQAFRFMHKSYKLLSRVTSVMYKAGARFWLSSGTCLGYYRECNFIPYSNDIDIGVHHHDYSPRLIDTFLRSNFTLKHKHGLPNDSLEVSLVASSIPEVKLDLFVFYEDVETHRVWNGATQPESRRKYKFTFPKFDLCWTEFNLLKVRVPCDTEGFLTAIYGPNWHLPQEYWDWKSSPHNVEFNGVWPESSLNETIQIFH